MRWAYVDNRLGFRDMEMRKLDARWDVDVPRPDVDEGERAGSDRVHLGLRLGRGRHATHEASAFERDHELAGFNSSSSDDV